MKFPNNGIGRIEFTFTTKENQHLPESEKVIRFDRIIESVNADRKIDPSDMVENATKAFNKALTAAELSGEYMEIEVKAIPEEQFND